jgi:hypothetical protein
MIIAPNVVKIGYIKLGISDLVIPTYKNKMPTISI